MPAAPQLGLFLADRRARTRPEDVGLPASGRRRVSGLRRQELAQLASVSPSYYTRLEQGRASGASTAVLDALAAALHLTPDETRHLHDLAHVGAGRAGPAAAVPTHEEVAPDLQSLLDTLGDVPAVVTGRRGDVLAWTRLGHALLASHLDVTLPQRPADRPNTAALVFCDSGTAALFVDWEAKAIQVVAHLRLLTGRHPEDRRLTALVGYLHDRSAEFTRLWADRAVAACDHAVHELAHPVVGRLTVTQQALRPVGTPEQTVLILTAHPPAALRELVAGPATP